MCAKAAPASPGDAGPVSSPGACSAESEGPTQAPEQQYQQHDSADPQHGTHHREGRSDRTHLRTADPAQEQTAPEQARPDEEEPQGAGRRADRSPAAMGATLQSRYEGGNDSPNTAASAAMSRRSWSRGS